MDELSFTDVEVRLGRRTVLRDVSLQVPAGALVALVGANGAGKTSLLRAGIGLCAPVVGEVRLAGGDPRALTAQARARAVAYLPQSRPLAWPLKVHDVVALGRFGYGVGLGRLRSLDLEAIARAVTACDLDSFVDRRTDELSGGELARVHVARALAAEVPLILADEPIAALDPLHAVQVMGALRAFTQAGGAALVTLHDLSLAARFSDRVLMLKEGRLLASGPPLAVLTPQTIADAFGVRAKVSAQGGITVIGPV
ncbi:MAG: ABC transporter ATP-binding protein [Caulobacterales bacterium]